MFKRLLVPLDGAEIASRSIDAGIALAGSLGAAITGFVVEPPVPLPSRAAHASDIAGAIAQAARDYGCDLILMVTQDRGILGRLLASSSTRAVLARARLPVLVMHEPGLIRDKPAAAIPA